MIVNIHEAKTNLSKLIARFQAGEEVIIAKNGHPILKFAPVNIQKEPVKPIGFFGCDIDLSRFDDPIEGMEEYQ